MGNATVVLGLGLKMCPSNMQCMFNNDLTQFMQQALLSTVAAGQNPQESLLTG